MQMQNYKKMQRTSLFPLTERFTFACADVHPNVVEFSIEHFDTGFYDTITIERTMVEEWADELLQQEDDYPHIESCALDTKLNDIINEHDIEDWLTENVSMAPISIEEFVDLCDDVKVMHLFLVGWMEQSLRTGVHKAPAWIARCILFGKEGWTFYPEFRGERAQDIMKLHNYLDKWQRWAKDRERKGIWDKSLFGSKWEEFKDRWISFTSELAAA